MNENIELRYSLRMLDKHGVGVDDIIISGDVPDFVNSEAVKVELHDISVFGKHWNMAHKLFTAIERLGLNEDILFSSDDHFLFRDADMDKWPRVKNGNLYTKDEYVAKHGKEPGSYQKSMIATRNLLERNRLPFVNCIRHINMHLDCGFAEDARSLMEQNASDSVYGFEPIAVLNNIAISKTDGFADEYIEYGSDVKCKTFGEVENILTNRNRNTFSISDSALLGGDLKRWFKKNYPHKSRWEK